MRTVHEEISILSVCQKAKCFSNVKDFIREVQSSTSRPSYRVEAVSSQHSDARWSRRRWGGSRIGRCADLRPRRARPEAGCTPGDLHAVIIGTGDVLQRISTQTCRRFPTKSMQSFHFAAPNCKDCFHTVYIPESVSAVLPLRAFGGDWQSWFSKD